MRRERDVAELHTALSALMNFVPDPPEIKRAWPWRGAEQSGAAAARVQEYLSELTGNGQWVWEENRVLRQFLQIPISSEKRQVRRLSVVCTALSPVWHNRPWCPPLRLGRRRWDAPTWGSTGESKSAPAPTPSRAQVRELLLRDIRAHESRKRRNQMLTDIKAGRHRTTHRRASAEPASGATNICRPAAPAAVTNAHSSVLQEASGEQRPKVAESKQHLAAASNDAYAMRKLSSAGSDRWTS